jgi:hypothetical protein
MIRLYRLLLLVPWLWKAAHFALPRFLRVKIPGWRNHESIPLLPRLVAASASLAEHFSSRDIYVRT